MPRISTVMHELESAQEGRRLVNITEVRMRRVETDNTTKAVASLTFDDSFVVHEVELKQRRGELFISMPSRRLPGGDYLDIAHPVNSSTREYIKEELVSVYEQAVAEGRRQYRITLEPTAD